jgi:hypothetical protein
MKLPLAVFIFFTSLLSAQAQRMPAPETLTITNVNVVDTRRGEILRNVTVVIRHGRIEGIAKVGLIGSTHNIQVVNATGKYLIPGLWDMHVHSAGGSGTPWDAKVILPLYIANGVTGIRDMGGDIKLLAQRRSAIERGSLLGPHIIFSGPFLDGGKTQEYTIAVNTRAEGERAVESLKGQGVDFIKVLSDLPRDAYFGVAEESKKEKLPFVGHVPESVGALEASGAGQKSIEHLSDILISCSRREGELRAERVEAARTGDMKAYHSAGMQALGSYDPQKAAQLFAQFVNKGTWQVPTLVWWQAVSQMDSPRLDEDDRLRFVPAWARKEWAAAKMPEQESNKELADLKAVFSRYVEMTGAMYRAGVPILAGTDSPDPYVYPGFALHEELGLLVKAGLTPLEALQAATAGPALFLGKAEEYGVVEKGRAADLVLLQANPLEDIGNTRKIEGVIVGGRYYSRKELNRMLDEAAQEAAKNN